MDLTRYFSKLMNFKPIFLLLGIMTLTACVSYPPPSDINNVCHIFKQYPKWYTAARDVEQRWKVPIAVQMAIVHQESKFDAHARPPRTKLLGIIPWKRPSTAVGYAQALHSTWALYKQRNGGILTSRGDFADGVDFIGWYANQANKTAGISRSDTYSLYLAYHEGVGGYQRKTYLSKPWLIGVARKVSSRASLYNLQLNGCKNSLKSRSWF